MHGTIVRSLWVVPLGFLAMMLTTARMVAAEAPGAGASAPQANQVAERDRLAKEVEELRRAGQAR